MSEMRPDRRRPVKPHAFIIISVSGMKSFAEIKKKAALALSGIQTAFFTKKAVEMFIFLC